MKNCNIDNDIKSSHTFYSRKKVTDLINLTTYHKFWRIIERKDILVSQKPIQKWTRDEQGQCLIRARLIQQLDGRYIEFFLDGIDHLKELLSSTIKSSDFNAR